MRIASIETMVTRLPLLKGDWRDTIHHVTHIELVLCTITSDTGVVGTGISHTSGDGGKTIESVIKYSLTPFLVGREISPRANWHAAWQFLHDLGGAGVTTHALGAVDIALWDLVGRSQNRSIMDILGRVHEKMPVYASGINLGLTEAELVDQVKGWYDAGYRSYKVKIGKPEVAEDIERLTKIREVIGNLPLMTDANQGWGLEYAARRINPLRGLDLTWVEEPLKSDDIPGHAALRRRIDTPIGIGENVYTIYQFRDYMVQDAVDYIQADLVRVGGITPYLEIADLALAFNRPMAPHFMLELSAPILCCLPNAYIAEDTDGGSLSALGALRNPIPVVDGHMTPNGLPGHGLEWDVEYFEKHRVP
jgi:L-alanine-DL-glutamate epimerase-like enolase superfamily enzyme